MKSLYPILTSLSFGGTLVEVPSGCGRTDIVILYQQHKYIIETKRFIDQSYFENGKYQLVGYLTSERLTEGYYVVFSNKHGDEETLYFDEQIAGKRFPTYIISIASASTMNEQRVSQW